MNESIVFVLANCETFDSNPVIGVSIPRENVKVQKYMNVKNIIMMTAVLFPARKNWKMLSEN